MAAIVREGDPEAALGLAVWTYGLAPERGAQVAVALAALTQTRLAARWPGAVVTPSWEGYRVRGLLERPSESVAAIQSALLAPVSAQEMPAVLRKLAALANKPLHDPALIELAKCRGEPFGAVPAPSEPSLAEVEGWRRAAHGLGRVALSATGLARAVNDVTLAVNATRAWPRAARLPAFGWDAAWATTSPAPVVYDARSEMLAEGTSRGLGGRSGAEARATLAFRTPDAIRPVAVAAHLADPRGTLAARLEAQASEGGAVVHAITATAHAQGGCLTVAVDVRDLGANPPARIATTLALVRQEVLAELAEADPGDGSGLVFARRAGDPREAAERAAWWELYARTARWAPGATNGAPPPKTEPTMFVAVGFNGGRDSTPVAPDGTRPPASPNVAPATPASPNVATATPASPNVAPATPNAIPTTAPAAPNSGMSATMRTELERALAAWRDPVVEPRIRVERGQSDLWVLLASPCGTVPEVDADAGLGAVFALIAAERAQSRTDPSLTIEPWASGDAIGLIAHGPALAGEAPLAHARRIGDAVARSFVQPPDLGLAARARAALLASAIRPDPELRGFPRPTFNAAQSRALVALAHAVVPGHPSWFSPSGSLEALARSSDGALLARATGLRNGPLRVAVLANEDAAQATAAARAVDRWLPRRPGETRVCSAPSEPPPPRPGTYTVDLVGAPSEAWLALPLARGDERAAQMARFFALALDGDDGLLARAVGGPGLARAWSAKVVGPSRGPALVLRITSAEGALDAAVAQTRALLDRLRQRGLEESDRQRAISARARTELRALLEPHGRLLGLFRDGAASQIPAPPSLDALRSFAANALRDDALVIVAARPPRLPPKATP
ncbi:hypothetical protein [Pendulispora albinea]|uniref:Peptidase M16 C-terminal domain-containing protein n=1 Tax=Pendulispora albinea TaxID=2741071 RepID=A0ABZ2LP21_9BACT